MAKIKSVVIGVLGMVCIPATYASGFFLQEASYANLGAAGAGDGVYTQSAASAWTNPAVMSHMDEPITTLSGTLLNLNMDYYDENGSLNTSSNSTLPVASFYHVTELYSGLKAGLLFSSPGGATLDYGSDWNGAAQLADVSLLTYQFNPTLSFDINEQLSFGVGMQANYAYLEGNTSSLSLEGATDWAVGFNVGTVYQVNEDLRIGASYRSDLEHDFASDVSSENRQGEYKTVLPFAAITDVSAAYDVSDKLTLLGSVQHHDWSKMNSTDIDIHMAERSGTYQIERDWDDVWRLSLGADYQLSNHWRVKLGYAYESSPLDNAANQSPDLPVGEQHRYSIGFSKQFESSQFDIYYQYSDFGDMDIAQQRTLDQTELHGSFTGSVHFIGAAYSF